MMPMPITTVNDDESNPNKCQPTEILLIFNIDDLIPTRSEQKRNIEQINR